MSYNKRLIVETDFYLPDQDGFERNNNSLDCDTELPPSVEELGRFLYAVHSTDYLPKNGYIRPLAMQVPGTYCFRPTIHWSLGELVASHDGYSWDDKKYAVVTPLNNLFPQLVNVFAHDTFTVGSFKLNSETMLVLPDEQRTQNHQSPAQIIRYNPSEESLRSAIKRAIAGAGGWSIRMNDGDVEYGSNAFWGEKNINTPNFFKNLLEKFPHLSFGTHLESERGEAWMFGALDRVMHMMAKKWDVLFFTHDYDAEIQFRKHFLQMFLGRLRNNVEQMPLHTRGQELFYRTAAQTESFIALVETEMLLRKKYQKTLHGAATEIETEVLRIYNERSLTSVKERILNTLEPVLSQENQDLNSYQEKDSIFVPLLIEMTATLNHQDMEELFSCFDGDSHLGKLCFNPSTKMFISIDRYFHSALGEENSHREFERICRYMDQIAGEEIEWQYFWQIVTQFLAENSCQFDRAIKFLNEPVIRNSLQCHHQIEYPESGIQTIPQLVRAHPETKILDRKNPFLSGFRGHNRSLVKILLKLDLISMPKEPYPDSLDSFPAAVSAAFNLAYEQREVRRAIKNMKKPMNTAWRDSKEILPGEVLNIFELLRRDSSLDEMWGKLGLVTEFRSLYPTDDLFWFSDKSFLEIVDEVRKLTLVKAVQLLEKAIATV